MVDKGVKNRTVLSYKEQDFIIWQDDKDNWVFSYDNNLKVVNSQTKDLQTALNIAHENIREMRPRTKRKSSRRNPVWNYGDIA